MPKLQRVLACQGLAGGRVAREHGWHAPRAPRASVRMRRWCAPIWMALCLSVQGAFAAAPAHPPLPHLPFYVATRGTQTIYLLGTLHVGDPVDYPAYQPFRTPILDALTVSSILAFELSPDDIVASQGRVNQYGVCRSDCLPKMLPPALWDKLAYRLRGNPVALDEIKKMRPWLAALLIETFSSLSAGLQTEYGTEAQLENIYLRAPLVGLETLDQEMRAFTTLTRAEQWEMLAQDLRQTPEQDVADVRTLHALWLAGDADKIAEWQANKEAQLAFSQPLSDAIDKKILYRRNRHFVARMIAIAPAQHPIFVAIGALHLGGPHGVLAILRQDGFTVKPA